MTGVCSEIKLGEVSKHDTDFASDSKRVKRDAGQRELGKMEREEQ